jgi:proteic killer suppression protein
MIRSFNCPDTKALFTGEGSPRFANIRAVAERKLQMLHRAVVVADLRSPPGNCLEALKGDRAGQFSIRINDQWRVCFTFSDHGADGVEIVDYHG